MTRNEVIAFLRTEEGAELHVAGGGKAAGHTRYHETRAEKFALVADVIETLADGAWGAALQGARFKRAASLEGAAA